MSNESITFVENRGTEVDWKEKATELARGIEALAIVCKSYRKCMMAAAKDAPEVPTDVKSRLMVEKLAVDKAMSEASEVLGKKYEPEEDEYVPRI